MWAFWVPIMHFHPNALYITPYSVRIKQKNGEQCPEPVHRMKKSVSLAYYDATGSQNSVEWLSNMNALPCLKSWCHSNLLSESYTIMWQMMTTCTQNEQRNTICAETVICSLKGKYWHVPVSAAFNSAGITGESLGKCLGISCWRKYSFVCSLCFTLSLEQFRCSGLLHSTAGLYILACSSIHTTMHGTQ